MKQRFSSLDVKVIARELSSKLCTLRLSNIYDLSSRIFLLKFAQSENRQQLVIDSGFRCHLTAYSRATAAAPSGFVTKLRKLLKTRRVTSVTQVGTDRVLEFQFSEGQYRLFVEFYAGGNVIVTDQELSILALLRLVPAGPGQPELRVGLKYDLSTKQHFDGVPELTPQRVRDGLQKAVDGHQDGTQAEVQRSRKTKSDLLRRALAISITELPPMLLEHAFATTGFDSRLQPTEVLADEALIESLQATLKEAKSLTQKLAHSDTPGFIIAKPKRGVNIQSGAAQLGVKELLYDDFHPFKPKQFVDDSSVRILEYETFNEAVDDFFSSVEGQKLEGRLQDREEHATKRIEAAKKDHEKRIGALQSVQELNIRKASAIEANVPRVQEAVGAINGLINQGMDWVEINRLIEMEQSRKNPVATMIKLPLKLYDNRVTLLLGEAEDDDDFEGDETQSEASSESDDEVSSKQRKSQVRDKRLDVDIDLGLSPWANARQYFDQKKSAAAKEQKTVQSSARALKSTEQKVQSDLKKVLKQEKQVLRPVRNPFWFEKFMYFISSDGYLVLGGKDAQQNEILYKRYMKRGDIYVHADLHGAATVIIKNKLSTLDAIIPPSTLSQAGNMAVATSKAWDSKAVMPAWWVNSDQVSKSAPAGEYLPTGSFMVRGKKNFLPPVQLVLGLGVMFQISEDSKAHHKKHRVVDDEKEADIDAPVNEVENDVQANQNGSADGKRADERPGWESDSLSDSDDEDFPDARLGSQNGDSDNESFAGRFQNPLQTSVAESQGDGKYATIVGMEDAIDHGLINNNGPNEQTKVKHMSAKERRDLRRGEVSQRNDNEDGSGSESGNEGTNDNNGNDDGEEGKSTIGSAGFNTVHDVQQKRGKRGKQKKAAKKYADQTAEDREVAMSLLGSKTGAERAAALAQAKAEQEAELERTRQRRREQHERRTAKIAEHEARRAAKEAGELEAGDGGHGEDREESEEEDNSTQSDILESLVGRPLPGDEILEAIPVCAPWGALGGRYKYAAKLQPGSVKKGKAAKEVLSRWISSAASGTGKKSSKLDESSQDPERPWPREIELIKAWRDIDVINALPVSKVRLMMAGGDKADSGAKNKGKAKGKKK